MKIFNKIRNKTLGKTFSKTGSDFLITALIALIISVGSAAISYKIASKKSPQFAVVDLAYLNNEFIVKLARYLTDHNVAEEKIADTVKSYITNLEAMLANLSKDGDYILLQKQSVASSNLTDITKDLEKVLFESALTQVKSKTEFEPNSSSNLNPNSNPNLRFNSKNEQDSNDSQFDLELSQKVRGGRGE
jgi:hypothetical protein